MISRACGNPVDRDTVSAYSLVTFRDEFCRGKIAGFTVGSLKAHYIKIWLLLQDSRHLVTQAE